MWDFSVQKEEIALADTIVQTDYSREDQDSFWDTMMKKIVERYPILLVKMINRTCGTDYSRDTKVEFLGTEFIVEKLQGNTRGIHSDVMIRINGKDIYHIEIQTRYDGNIAVRFLEYDIAAALQHGTQRKPLSADDKARGLKRARGFIHNRPKPILINLTHAQHEPEIYESKILDNNGNEWEYKIRVVNAQQLSLKEMVEYELYLLIPFIPLRFYVEVMNKKEPIECLQETIDELIDTFHKCREIFREICAGDEVLENISEYLIDGFKEASIYLFGEYEIFWEEVKKMSDIYYFKEERIAMAEKQAKEEIAMAEKQAKEEIAMAEKQAKEEIAMAEKQAKKEIAMAEERATREEQRAIRAEEELRSAQAENERLRKENEALNEHKTKRFLMFVKNWKHYMFL